MSDLDKSTRALLELGRDGDEPTEREMRDNRRSLAALLGAATVLGTTAVGSGSAAAAAGGLKLTTFLACLALGGAVGAGVISVASSRHAPVAPSSMGAETKQKTAPTDVAGSRGLPDVVAASPARAERTAPRPVAPATRTNAHARQSRSEEPLRTAPAVPTATFPEPPARRSIDQELELVRTAEDELHRGSPARALEAVAAHARRFPDGALWEEREVTRILALCQLGDVSGARASADRFIARAPASPFADRVREACPLR